MLIFVVVNVLFVSAFAYMIFNTQTSLSTNTFVHTSPALHMSPAHFRLAALEFCYAIWQTAKW